MLDETKYQIAIIGPKASRYRDALIALVTRRARILSKRLPGYIQWLKADEHQELNNKSPIVGVYIGPGKPSSEDLQSLATLSNVADVIVPAVDNTTDFTTKVPDSLHPINGFELDTDPTLDKLANLVLENLGLLRKGRRLFISYRRSESSEIAQQLRDSLDQNGFDVFLDTHSVPRGDVFQQVLWQRLADSEIMVILDTDGFLKSRWTSEELAEAHAMSVAMIQLIWPNATRERYSELCHPIYMASSHFDGTVLKPAVITRITRTIEGHRARALASRHDNLTGEFYEVARQFKASPIVQPQRYISAQRRNGRQVIAIPAIGVVDASLYHDASLRFDGQDKDIILLYDGRGLRPGWADFLTWLDKFLPVKAVRITDAAKVFV